MAKTEISESELLVSVLVAGLQEKKGEDITTLDLRNLKNTFAEFMVLCSGSNYKQLEALVDSAEDFARKQLKEKPFVREGVGQESEWLVLDFVNVVVHIFLKDKRDFYALEELWGDAKIKNYSKYFFI